MAVNKAIKLEWNEGHYWTGSVHLPSPAKYQYKYIVISYDKAGLITHSAWDEGANKEILLVEPSTSTSTRDISVMSFNVRYENQRDGANGWEYRRSHVAKLIADSNCDIVCLQEVRATQQKYLADTLGMYAWTYISRDGDQGEGTPIYYRKDRWCLEQRGVFWLSDTPDKVASSTYGNEIPRIVTWAKLRRVATQLPVIVFNTHYDHISSEIRTKSSVLFAEQIKRIAIGWPNRIVLGDFNAAAEDAEMVTLMTNADLRNTVGEESKQGTFHSWTGNAYFEKIDHIMTSPNIQCSNFAVITTAIDKAKGLYPSDHFPIMARLRLPVFAP